MWFLQLDFWVWVFVFDKVDFDICPYRQTYSERQFLCLSVSIHHCSKFLVKIVFLSTVVIAFVGESIACSLLLCAEEEPMYEGGNFCRLLSTPLPELRQEVNAVL